MPYQKFRYPIKTDTLEGYYMELTRHIEDEVQRVLKDEISRRILDDTAREEKIIIEQLDLAIAQIDRMQRRRLWFNVAYFALGASAASGWLWLLL